jgi:phage shock protein E
MHNKNGWVYLLSLLLTLTMAGCGTLTQVNAGVIDSKPGVVQKVEELSPDLSVAEVAAVMDGGKVMIVDVREEYEYNDGHIPGAELIPLGEIPGRLDEIPQDMPVILVCRSGNRSGQAYQYLTTQGYTDVHNMLGGMLEWSASGYDVER